MENSSPLGDGISRTQSSGRPEWMCGSRATSRAQHAVLPAGRTGVISAMRPVNTDGDGGDSGGGGGGGGGDEGQSFSTASAMVGK